MRIKNKYRYPGAFWGIAISLAIGYFLIWLQFFTQSKISYNLVTWALGKVHLQPMADVKNDPDLWVSSIIGIPYVASISIVYYNFFGLISRLTQNERLDRFSNALHEIEGYHSLKTADGLWDSLSSLDGHIPHKLDDIKGLSKIMIDLLITDLRDAFQELCQIDDIRVSIYLKNKVHGSDDGELRMAYTTEFNKDLSKATYFPWNERLHSYEGLCGAAWTLRKVTYGTPNLVPLVKIPALSDKVLFYGDNPLHRGRSFLCFPFETKETLPNQSIKHKVIAVICIDSGNRFSFTFMKDSSKIAERYLFNIHKHLEKYLLWSAYANGNHS